MLVTGGAGFIGSHIAERLLEEAYSVTVIDNLDPYYDVGIKRRNVDRCEEVAEYRIRFFEGNITDEVAVETLFEGA